MDEETKQLLRDLLLHVEQLNKMLASISQNLFIGFSHENSISNLTESINKLTEKISENDDNN